MLYICSINQNNMTTFLSPEVVFKSLYPPTVVTLSGVTYVCPGWHVVPFGTTVAEAMTHWVEDLPAEIIRRRAEEARLDSQNIEEMVPSSKAGKFYKVKYKAGQWTCQCDGFGFKHKCSHIDKVKAAHLK